MVNCIFCNVDFIFNKNHGVAYRHKPVCSHCGANLFWILFESFKDVIKKDMAREAALDFYKRRDGGMYEP